MSCKNSDAAFIFLRAVKGILAVLMIAIAIPACPSAKIVAVDQKTQLENQILGTFDDLEKDLVLSSSVRGDGLDENKIPAAHRETLIAMMNRQFNHDDVVALKLAKVAGESQKGMLTFFETERTRNNPAFRKFARRIIKEENRDRKIIMERAISINPSLTRKDYPIIESIMQKLSIESSPPETLIQSSDGEWTEKNKEPR